MPEKEPKSMKKSKYYYNGTEEYGFEWGGIGNLFYLYTEYFREFKNSSAKEKESDNKSSQLIGDDLGIVSSSFIFQHEQKHSAKRLP